MAFHGHRSRRRPTLPSQASPKARAAVAKKRPAKGSRTTGTSKSAAGRARRPKR